MGRKCAWGPESTRSRRRERQQVGQREEDGGHHRAVEKTRDDAEAGVLAVAIVGTQKVMILGGRNPQTPREQIDKDCETWWAAPHPVPRSLEGPMQGGGVVIGARLNQGGDWSWPWTATPGTGVPINHEGCKQGAPESPVLWNMLLDEAMGPVPEEWQRMGIGIYLPAFEAEGPDGDAPRNWGGAAGWVNLLAYVDDLLLPPKSEEEVFLKRTFRWPSEHSVLEKDFSGGSAAASHLVAFAWYDFWARTGQMCTAMLSLRVRLQKVRAEVLLVLPRPACSVVGRVLWWRSAADCALTALVLVQTHWVVGSKKAGAAEATVGRPMGACDGFDPLHRLAGKWRVGDVSAGLRTSSVAPCPPAADRSVLAMPFGCVLGFFLVPSLGPTLGSLAAGLRRCVVGAERCRRHTVPLQRELPGAHVRAN